MGGRETRREKQVSRGRLVLDEVEDPDPYEDDLPEASFFRPTACQVACCICTALMCGAVMIGGVVAAVQLSVGPSASGVGGGGEDERVAQPSSLVSGWSSRAKAAALRQHEEEVRAASAEAAQAAEEATALLAAAEAAKSKAEAARAAVAATAEQSAEAAAANRKAEAEALERAEGAKQLAEDAAHRAEQGVLEAQARAIDALAQPPPSPSPSPPPPAPPPPSPSPLPPPPSYTLEYTVPPYTSADNVEHARALCVQQGGELASFDSLQQVNLALGVVLKYGRDRATIGASVAGQGAQWTWQGVEPMTYTHWAPGQPDDPNNEQCAEMWTTGRWNDVPCWEGPRAYVCEVAVPTPAFTFPCGAAVVKALGLQSGTAAAEAATCRYDVSALSTQEKMAISWDVARDRCVALGGGAQLAEPRTTLQTQFLAHALRQHGAESLWIGLRKEGYGKTVANFRWAGSGELLQPTEARWSATEPNGEVGDCVEMWEDGTWNDRSCEIGKVLACEVPVK